ncbi:MAG: efflux RND transporter periplasmic adaptor subunit [Kangiellaceae bacterium]|nr:efflux RND transporter periplasmic adaptor subunit [Kangiellaceae bacterium]
MQQHKKKNIWLAWGLPLLIVVVVVMLIRYMMGNKPKAFDRPQREAVEVVEVKPIEFTDYQILVDSYGNIQAATSGNLVAQVSGLIIEVSPQFETGRAFEKGDWLVKLDARDYQIEVTIAQAELANARLTLNEELAKAEQAKRDWQKINGNRTASALVLREPQVASAKARLEAAQARLNKAKLSLSRATIVAPYSGYIIEKRADLGQLVNGNTPVATIFASDSLEVRLPVASNKVQFLQLESSKQDPVQIKLQADFGGLSKQWIATLDRTDSVIDDATRQWFVTAKLPADLLEKESLLKVGQFVSAEIEGRLLSQVVVIPSKLISQEQQIYIYDNGLLRRQKVKVLWQSDEMSVVDPMQSEPQLTEGMQLVTTALNFVADGAKARLKDERPDRPRDQTVSERTKKATNNAKGVDQ